MRVFGGKTEIDFNGGRIWYPIVQCVAGGNGGNIRRCYPGFFLRQRELFRHSARKVTCFCDGVGAIPCVATVGRDSFKADFYPANTASFVANAEVSHLAKDRKICLNAVFHLDFYAVESTYFFVRNNLQANC